MLTGITYFFSISVGGSTCENHVILGKKMEYDLDRNFDLRVRMNAFDWLSEQVNIYGEVLPRKILVEGFIFENDKIPLVSPQGIFKPKSLTIPLTISTTPSGPYRDTFDEHERCLSYKYRGTDPNHRDNVGLRRAMELSLPLAYFHGVVPGKYLAVWPVYIIGDDLDNLTFRVAVDDQKTIYPIEPENSLKFSDLDSESRRTYITTITKQRLHQSSFRERVLLAYRRQCAICKLRHQELLDAAHIIPDNEPDSKPIIPNGIALCKLHHAAFDRFMIAIKPDYLIEVRRDILNEKDGPMLIHALQEIHNLKIQLPYSEEHWPSLEYLKQRYKKFRKVI